MTASGQLKMPRLGNFCVTMLGDGASDADVARGADFASTSSDPQHGVKSIADGDAKSYWASALDPTAPVDVQVDFGTSRQIKSIEIDWEHPAQVRSQSLSANMQGRRVLTLSVLIRHLSSKSQRQGNGQLSSALPATIYKPRDMSGLLFLARLCEFVCRRRCSQRLRARSPDRKAFLR